MSLRQAQDRFEFENDLPRAVHTQTFVGDGRTRDVAGELFKLTDVTALINAGLLNRTENGIEFPYEAVHVDFMVKAA